jgi:RNA polymerase sigma-70 factor (ECF subfamily)
VATVDYVGTNRVRAAAATDALYRRHRDRVLRYCRGFLRRPADAEDAVQQTFLQVQRALGHGVEPVSEAAWLLTIARNVCLTRIDSEQRRARVEIAADPSVLAESAGAVDAPADLSDDVAAALAALPERQRRALYLREWHGLSYAEIAEMLETTEAAVETLLFRARDSIAVALGARNRRRRSLDLAGFLGWAKSAAGVGGSKLAAGAAALATATAVGVAGSDSVQVQKAPHARPAAHASTLVTERLQAAAPPARTTRPVVHHRRARHVRTSVAAAAAPVPAPASAQALAPSVATAPIAQPPQGATAATPHARPSAAAPAAAAPPAAAPQTPVSQVVTTATTPTDPVVKAVSGTVDSTVKTVSGTVDSTVKAVSGTVDSTVKAVSGTVDSTVKSVSDTVAATTDTASSTVDSTVDTVNDVTQSTTTLVSDTVSSLFPKKP